MKLNPIRKPFTNSPDTPGHEDAIPLVLVLESWLDHGMTLSVRDEKDNMLADVYLEYKDGQVALYVWDEDDVFDEHTAKHVLIENPREASRKAQEDRWTET